MPIDFDFLNRLDGELPAFWIWATISYGDRDLGVEGVKATAKSSNFATSGVSDENGNLKLVVPAEGKFKVRIHLPKGKTYSEGLRNDKTLREEQQKIWRGGKLEGRRRYLDYEVVVSPNNMRVDRSVAYEF